MTVRPATQYSPEQILDAGRRAEAEGKVEYALQFYRHIADQYRSSPEAQLALEALARLQGPPLPPPSPTPGLHLDPPDYATHPRSRPPAHGMNGDGRRSASMPGEAARSRPIELPPAPVDYRLARFAARMASWTGFPLALLGLAAAAGSIAVSGAAGKLPLVGWMFLNPGYGLTLAAAGVLMALAGQLVRALLDTALATRDIAAIMRAQHEPPEGRADPEERPRRRSAKRRL